MKPIKLKMTAFGPYANHQIIDFSKLENRKMFVVSGKTGAGKTTIFDAISFAMYGKPSGDNRTASDMRSQFADPKQLTEVELLFELKNRTYLIRRTPQQEKLKARGGGTTTAGATAELYEWSDGGSQVLLAANVRETDEKISELIGLEANQFKQILMIPQGEFQKLLMANSQEKEKILQKLFQTSFYKQVEEILKEKSDALKNEAGKAADQQITLMKSLPPYSNEMRELLEQENLEKSDVFHQLALDFEKMEIEREKIQNTIKEINLKRDLLLGERERALALKENFDRLSATLKEKEKLEEKKDEIHNMIAQIRQGERAESLLSYELYVEKTKKAAVSALNKKQEAEKSRAEISELYEKAAQNLKEKQEQQPQREEKRKHLQKLESIKSSVYAYSDAVEQEKTARSRLEKTKQAGKTLLRKEQDLLVNEQLAEEKLKKLSSSQERLIQAEHLIEKFTYLLEQFEELKVLKAKLSECENAEQAAEEKNKKTAEMAVLTADKLQNLRIQVKNGQAAFLARQLAEGKPCAVCGSTHHPNPAAGEAFLIHEEVIERAEQTADEAAKKNRQAEQALLTARFSVQSAKKEIEKLNARLPENLHLEEAAENLVQAKKARSEALKDKIKKEEIEHQLQEYKKEKRQLSYEIEKNREAEISEHGVHIKAQSELAHLKQLVPEKMRDVPFFIQEFKRAEDEALKSQQELEEANEAFQKWSAAFQTAESILKEREQIFSEARHSLQEAENSFTARRLEAGFESEELYKAAKQFVETIKQLKERVQLYEEEQRQINLQITELKKLVEGRVRPDLESLENNIRSLNEELEIWTDKAGAILSQIKESTRIQEAINQIAMQMADVEEQYRLAGHLYHVTHGKNELKVTFERYVLASFLEDILAAANTRLTGMTNGRFLLKRQKERAKGNAQSGLDLLVFDQYTGASRHVKTLSGGESFKAALALALGLAEVVQNHAGGVSLETMFVDEGFGTLDPESLDQAIETLMDIQADGRLVGIISHVPELKERIDARLEVYQTDSGSKAAFVFAGEA